MTEHSARSTLTIALCERIIKEEGLNWRQFAIITGVDRASIFRIRQGKRQAGEAVLRKIATAFPAWLPAVRTLLVEDDVTLAALSLDDTLGG
jgi:transcriptional regulator with XRE-family HTH domain